MGLITKLDDEGLAEIERKFGTMAESHPGFVLLASLRAALEEISLRRESERQFVEIVIPRIEADLAAALARLKAAGIDAPEPGELIAEISCPSCGRALRVEHGDDEGEIGVLTND